MHAQSQHSSHSGVHGLEAHYSTPAAHGYLEAESPEDEPDAEEPEESELPDPELDASTFLSPSFLAIPALVYTGQLPLLRYTVYL